MKLYHGTNCNSAKDIVKNGICLQHSKPFLDFGPGFYTTPSYDHAALTAIRKTRKYNARYKQHEEPYIVELDFRPINGVKLSTVAYQRHSEKWGRFVLNNRLTPDILSAYNRLEHNQDAKYDVCYGEIADGKIVNKAYMVNNGLIMPEEVDYNDFIKNNRDVYPQQYSFHTLKAVSCIKVICCATINNKEKYFKLIGRR